MSREAKNVPRGLYRNSQSVELYVVGPAMPMNGWPTLSGDIAIAEDRSELRISRHLVTRASLEVCGYELIEPATEEL